MHGQTEPHDMGIILLKFQRRSILWQGIQIHGKEIASEFAVDIMKLIAGFAMRFLQVFFVDFFEISAVIGTILVYAFVDSEEFSVLDGNQGMAAVRAGKL